MKRPTKGGTVADARTSMGKALTAFLILKTVWSWRAIRNSTELRRFKARVETELSCGSQ